MEGRGKEKNHRKLEMCGFLFGFQRDFFFKNKENVLFVRICTQTSSSTGVKKKTSEKN